jgi:predicted alpha-1,2-mannosidase
MQRICMPRVTAGWPRRMAVAAAGVLAGGILAAVPAAADVAEAGSAAAATPVADPVSMVNPLLDTGSGGAGGPGDAFPGPDVPFGMMQWSPDTSPNRQAGGGYYYGDSSISGFSLTHIDGPGCAAFGDVPILPTVGALPSSPSSATEPFSHSGESASADYYSVQTGSPAVKTELTEAAHSAIGQFTFPSSTQSNLLFKLSGSQNGDSATSAQVIGNNEVQGSVSSGHFCGGPDAYTVYFDITFDHPFTGHGTWTGSTITPGAMHAAAKATTKTAGSPPGNTAGSTASPGAKVSAPVFHSGGHPAAAPVATTNPDGMYLTFDTTSNPVVQAKTAISWVSSANAKANWQAEQPGWNFGAVHTSGIEAWNKELSKIQIGGGPADREQVFYSAMYHSLLHPNIFSDVNGQYMGFDNQVHTAQAGHVQVANYSGWDIYRTQAQLEAIVDPQMASDAAQSMVNDAAQNNGMLPKWSLANGESYTMVGDPADGILGGYYAFGARDFDTASALKYAMAEATKPSNIRPGLNYYDQQGYLPTDGSYGCCNYNGPVSTTEEYAAADFALSNFAAALGDSSDAQMLVKRSQNWQTLYNPATGLIQPKTADGAFVPASLTTTDGYVEGDASQYRWETGWNMAGLVAAMGGKAATNQQLDTFFTDLNDGSGSPYSFWADEYEYAVPWAYDYTGEPYKTQQVVNQIRSQLYTDNPMGSEGGNDDLGAMSSMGVMTMLGMSPEYISTADMVLNSPEFPLEIIHLGNGHTITVNAPGASSASNYYVQSMKLNGSPWNRPLLPGSAFTKGATVDFTVGSKPNPDWGAAPQNAPPSYGAGDLPVIGYTTPSDLIKVQPGQSATLTIGGKDLIQGTYTVNWKAAPPPGMTVTPSSGTLKVTPGTSPTQTATVTVSSGTRQGFYDIPVSFSAGSQALPSAGPSLAVIGNGDTATVCTTLGSSNTDNGLSQAEGGDGTTTPVTVGGMSGRQTVQEVPNDLNMYFLADPRIAYNGAYTVTFTITYYDTGTNGWTLQYDSTNPNGGPVQGAYTNGLTVTNQNTNTWKTVTATVSDARFAERENNSSDFRIASPQPVTIHSVQTAITGAGVLPMDLCSDG